MRLVWNGDSGTGHAGNLNLARPARPPPPPGKLETYFISPSVLPEARVHLPRSWDANWFEIGPLKGSGAEGLARLRPGSPGARPHSPGHGAGFRLDAGPHDDPKKGSPRGTAPTCRSFRAAGPPAIRPGSLGPAPRVGSELPIQSSIRKSRRNTKEVGDGE